MKLKIMSLCTAGVILVFSLSACSGGNLQAEEDVGIKVDAAYDQVMESQNNATALCASVYANDDNSLVQIVGMSGDASYYEPFCIELTKDSQGEYSGKMVERFNGSLKEKADLQPAIGTQSNRDFFLKYANILYAALQESLYDPESAQYDYFRTYISTDEIVVVTNLNSKNRLGGYAGKTTYVITIEKDSDDINIMSNNKDDDFYSAKADDYVDAYSTAKSLIPPLAIDWDISELG